MLWHAGSARAQAPYEALDTIPRSLYVRGMELEERGSLDGAILRYQKVLELEPGWTQALLDLGRVLQLQGRLDEAEAVYGRAPYDADAVEAQAWLMLRTDRPDRAARLFRRLRDLRPETTEFLVHEARATGQSDARAAAEILHLYLDGPAPGLVARRSVETFAEVARRLHREQGVEEASELLDRLVEALEERGAGSDVALAAVEKLRERFVVEAEARALAAAAGVALIPQQRGELARAREAFSAGGLAEAEELLLRIIEENHRSHEAWAALSDVREARGDVAGAEQAIQMAEGLAPHVATYPARLGDLLSQHYGGRFQEEAAEAYGRALQRQGARSELWVYRGEALQRSGQPERAIASFRRYLAEDPEGRMAARAAREIQGWGRVRPEAPVLPRAPGRPASVPEQAWTSYHIAEVLYRRSNEEPERLQEALAELMVAREQAPDFVPGVNLEATLRRGLGEVDAARALYLRSLELSAAQPEVLTLVAELERREGDHASADARLEQAAALGSAEALLILAERDASRWRLLAAREHLDAYFGSTTSGVSYEEGVALRAQVERRLLGVRVGGVGGLLLATLLPLTLRWRRRSGQSLEALLSASPTSWREVARIASAIRHEVLKHHTTVLSTVADALDDRDPGPARWASDKLFGPHGATARFQAYIDELVSLGQAFGVRLNLRYRDPVLGGLIEAMDRLSALEGELRTGGGRRLAQELRELSSALNDTGYHGLGRLIRRVCLLSLDEGLIREVWDAVRGEPALREVSVNLEIRVPPEAIWLRIFKGDLHDILANLLRNAVEASAEAGQAQIGVFVSSEEDEITGLERVALRVADRAQGRISTEKIRGRYIGRGLGLAVDLISRNGGSIHVESEEGWEKAIVVRLPRIERGADEEEL